MPMLRLFALFALFALDAEAGSDQTRSRVIEGRDAAIGVLNVSAPNQQGGYLCPACLAWASFGTGIGIEPENPEAPVRVTVDGRAAFVWLRWAAGVYFEMPAETATGRAGAPHYARVELRQGAMVFVGSAPVVAGAPAFLSYPDGRLAGLWRYGQGAPVLLASGPVRIGSERTVLLLQAVNVGLDAMRRGRVAVWIGAREFEGVIGDTGFPGIVNVGIEIASGEIESGWHSVRMWAGRWTAAMPDVGFAWQLIRYRTSRSSER